MSRGAPYRPFGLALLAACLAIPAHAVTYPPEGLGDSLPSLLKMAEEQNPELNAFSEEAAAAAERIQPAGALPDPVFAFELRDIPANTLSAGGAGSTRYQVKQAIPLWGKRELRSSAAASAASASQSAREAARLDIRAKVKIAYAQFYTAQRSYLIIDELKWLALALQDVAQIRYVAGLVPQQDVAKAQLERWSLTNELVAIEAERHHAAGQLNLMLGRAPEALLALPKALPDMPEANFRPSLLQQALLENNPTLAEMEAKTKAVRDNETLVYKNRYPDLTVGLGPIQRGGRIESWDLAFEIDIPLQQDSRRAREREASALARAAEARKQTLRNELLNRLNEIRIAYETYSKQRTLLIDTLLPQADLTYQSALAGYQTGKVDFANVLDAQRQVRKVRFDLAKIELDRYLQLVELERLIGKDL